MSIATSPSGIVIAQAPSKQRRGLGKPIASLLVYGLPTVMILLPLVSFLASSFLEQDNGRLTGDLTFANYAAFFTSSSYLYVFYGTLKLAFIVALISLVFGYILSYLIWRLEGSARYLLLLLSALPLVMNYVVKIYAMRSILGFNGFLNSTLLTLGVIDMPSRLVIFNQTAVMLTMAVIYLPFGILPIFLALERIPPSLIAAAADLGAKPGQIFLTVVLPLSLPGSIAAALFVMVIALGDYLTPQMVGGSEGFTFGRAVWSQFGMAFNWPFGAALAVMLLLAVVALIALASLISRTARIK
ncbi:ABC transporter permease [Rhizobium ruizarguesonis]|uniref:ABC transporter permease n=1 Tax=Rhizobium ruizarguesonis TaxID=2081791 RepID=UPI00040F08FC|nr:ABC transporter permease [Rhizobium ruizarguesonis]MBY5851610.1 ABC transporter permease [Rhizobium leguminosarum]NKL25757.1 ABC transporter permease subunit [Rhizobium leguminosarum bv. viciae]MBY5873387.1 ABC transporter permease [Rhizobium leguminosarum]MBY5892405.1 ABC transporter permease [Rhizobium leguminosarum]NEH38254.1 ABC transporter permease subunit [Rhizobium ruizarguesonis]